MPPDDTNETPARANPQGLVRRIMNGLVAPEDVRGTTYLLLDFSASMGDEGKLAQLHRGALRFFAEAWQLGYAVGAIGFSRRAELVQPATRDFGTFQRSLRVIRADGQTAMTKAIRLGTRKLSRASGDRALLLITDGMPDRPEAALAAAREARAAGITLVAVGTDHADEAFLAALAGRPELATHIARDKVDEGMASAARHLDRDEAG